MSVKSSPEISKLPRVIILRNDHRKNASMVELGDCAVSKTQHLSLTTLPQMDQSSSSHQLMPMAESERQEYPRITNKEPYSNKYEIVSTKTSSSKSSTHETCPTAVVQHNSPESTVMNCSFVRTPSRSPQSDNDKSSFIATPSTITSSKHNRTPISNQTPTLLERSSSRHTSRLSRIHGTSNHDTNRSPSVRNSLNRTSSTSPRKSSSLHGELTSVNSGEKVKIQCDTIQKRNNTSFPVEKHRRKRKRKSPVPKKEEEKDDTADEEQELPVKVNKEKKKKRKRKKIIVTPKITHKSANNDDLKKEKDYTNVKCDVECPKEADRDEEEQLDNLSNHPSKTSGLSLFSDREFYVERRKPNMGCSCHLSNESRYFLMHAAFACSCTFLIIGTLGIALISWAITGGTYVLDNTTFESNTTLVTQTLSISEFSEIMKTISNSTILGNLTSNISDYTTTLGYLASSPIDGGTSPTSSQ